MGGETSGQEVYLYLISCRLGLVKIGVADDPGKRLRELQVGSPVELKPMLTRPYADRLDAEAVAAELCRRFGGRRGRGSWYRLTLAEVRHALAAPALLEAPARARAAAAAAARERAVAPRRRKQLRTQTEQQRAYQRRRRQERTRKQKRAARLRAAGWRQDAIAAELGVTTRTLRNWKSGPPTNASWNANTHGPPASRPRRPPANASRQPAPAPAAASEPAIEVDDGVPIFPDTTAGRTARLAYYETLNNLPFTRGTATPTRNAANRQYGSAERANGATAAADDKDRRPEQVARTS